MFIVFAIPVEMSVNAWSYRDINTRAFGAIGVLVRDRPGFLLIDKNWYWLICQEICCSILRTTLPEEAQRKTLEC